MRQRRESLPSAAVVLVHELISLHEPLSTSSNHSSRHQLHSSECFSILCFLHSCPRDLSTKIIAKHNAVTAAITEKVAPGPMRSSTTSKIANAPAAKKQRKRFDTACAVAARSGSKSMSKVFKVVKHTCRLMPRKSCRTRLTAKCTAKCKHHPYAARRQHATASGMGVLRKRAFSMGNSVRSSPFL
jgi:hypothetical protein